MALAHMRSSTRMQLGSSTQQRLPAAAARRSSTIARGRLLQQDAPGTVPWHEKNKELWLELKDLDELQAAQVALPEGKLLVVDYYAGWCAVCKAAYPAMCRMADDAGLQQGFVFAKASLDNAGVKAWVKEEGIKGIPHISCYSPSGAKIFGMGASFKKADAIRANLEAVAAARDDVVRHGQQLALDEDFHVVLPAGVNVAA